MLMLKKKMFAILFCICIGVIVGGILSANPIFYSSIQNYISNMHETFSGNKIMLLESEFIKHGKFILFIWLFALIPFGNIFILLILMSWGICYGCGATLLFRCYKISAILYITKLMLIPGVIMIFAMTFLSLASMNNIKRSKLESSIVLGIGLSAAFLSAILDVYLLPNVF